MNIHDQPATKGDIATLLPILEYLIDHIRHSTSGEARSEAESWRETLREARNRLYQ